MKLRNKIIFGVICGILALALIITFAVIFTSNKVLCETGQVYLDNTNSCLEIIKSETEKCIHDVQCQHGKWGELSRCYQPNSRCECFAVKGRAEPIDGVCELTRGRVINETFHWIKNTEIDKYEGKLTTVTDEAKYNSGICRAVYKAHNVPGNYYVNSKKEHVCEVPIDGDEIDYTGKEFEVLLIPPGTVEWANYSGEIPPNALALGTDPNSNDVNYGGRGIIKKSHEGVVSDFYVAGRVAKRYSYGDEWRAHLSYYGEVINNATVGFAVLVLKEKGRWAASREGSIYTVGGEDAIGEEDDDESRLPLEIIIVGGVVLVALLPMGLFCWITLAKKKKDMISVEESSTVTTIKPNLNRFRTIHAKELCREKLLGSGAFGIVHRGSWRHKDNVVIPVAIKVLKYASGPQATKEFLSEAFIMASVEHPNLLRLLCACVTSELQLVTQLMPLGDLREYLQKNKANIGSKVMLNWCTQIASGMEYLEGRRLVHRDLAARNVLVQSPTCVKITDFGLAKMLDWNEVGYTSGEDSKVPVRWLALECFMERIYTHKTDVWAFGVTVWELLTYGQVPYKKETSTSEIIEMLMEGERLKQPEICSLDLFRVLLKTWMFDPNCRPTFSELVQEFTKMSGDPGRYLVIEGDELMRLPAYSPQDEMKLLGGEGSCSIGENVEYCELEYVETRINSYLDQVEAIENDEYLRVKALKQQHTYYNFRPEIKEGSDQKIG